MAAWRAEVGHFLVNDLMCFQSKVCLSLPGDLKFARLVLGFDFSQWVLPAHDLCLSPYLGNFLLLFL